MVKRMMPMPPTHCVIARHSSSARGIDSSPLITVEPVVVNPATTSKKASTGPRTPAKMNGRAPPSEASLLQALYGHDGFSDAGAEATFEAALLNAELHLGGSPACFDSAGDAVSAATFSAVAAAGGIVHYSRTRRQRQFEDDLLNAEPNPAPEPAPERLCSVCLADEVKVVIIWRCPRCCDGD